MKSTEAAMSYAKEMLDAIEAGQMETAKQLFTQVLAHDDDETQYNLAKNCMRLGSTVRLSGFIKGSWGDILIKAIWRRL